MTVLLDTSLLISCFVDDIHSKKAIQMLHAIITGEITAHVPAFVLVEFCGALSRKVGTENATLAFRQVQEWVETETLHPISQTEQTYSIAQTLALRYGIKGADAIIAALSKQYNLQLATFDKELHEKLKSEMKFHI